MPRGTKSVKNAKINHEIAGKSKEDLIHTMLRECGFAVLREKKYKDDRFQQKRKERNVDFKVAFGKFSLIVESDGDVHGDLENQTASTIKRNKDFERAELNYSLINHSTIRYLTKIFKEKQMLSGVNFEELIPFVACYRVLEEYAKHAQDSY